MSMVHLSSEDYRECVACCDQVKELDRRGSGHARGAGAERRRHVLVALLQGTARLRDGDLEGAVRTLKPGEIRFGAELDHTTASVMSHATAASELRHCERERHFEVD